MSNRADIDAINDYVVKRSAPPAGAPARVVRRWESICAKWSMWYHGLGGSWYVSGSDLAHARAVRNELMKLQNPDSWASFHGAPPRSPKTPPLPKPPLNLLGIPINVNTLLGAAVGIGGGFMAGGPIGAAIGLPIGFLGAAKLVPPPAGGGGAGSSGGGGGPPIPDNVLKAPPQKSTLKPIIDAHAQGKWPTQDLKQRAAEEQVRHNALYDKQQVQYSDAVSKAKAKNDRAAIADIERRHRERMKALADMQDDIRRAQEATGG